MADIQFNEDQFASTRPTASAQPSWLLRMVYATGLATTEQGAQGVLIGIAVIAAIVAVALPVLFLHSSPAESVPAPYVPPAHGAFH